MGLPLRRWIGSCISGPRRDRRGTLRKSRACETCSCPSRMVKGSGICRHADRSRTVLPEAAGCAAARAASSGSGSCRGSRAKPTTQTSHVPGFSLVSSAKPLDRLVELNDLAPRLRTADGRRTPGERLCRGSDTGTDAAQWGTVGRPTPKSARGYLIFATGVTSGLSGAAKSRSDLRPKRKKPSFPKAIFGAHTRI